MISVLVVDDRPDVRLSLMYMLEAAGFTVLEAGDGREALAVLGQKRVDVLLTDLYMPGMDGISLVDAIRNRLSRPPRLVMMTGKDVRVGSSAVIDAMEQGAEAMLIKPFTKEQLVRAIQQAPRLGLRSLPS